MEKFGTAIILAGGKASRMGFDKQFLEIDNIKLVDKIISILEEEFNEIILITNKPQEYPKERYKLASDIIKEKGPLSGIHVGLKMATSAYVFVIACDMPNIDLDYVRYMKEEIEKKDAKACITKVEKGLEPFHGFYSKSLVEDIEEYLKTDRRSIQRFLADKDIIYIEEEDAKGKYNRDIFINLNTMEEVKKYIKK